MNRTLISHGLLLVLLCSFAASAIADEAQRELVSELRRRRVPFKQVDGKLVAVNLEKHRDVSRWVPELAKVVSLEEIQLGNSAVSDADVRSLAVLPNLTTFDAPHTTLTDRAAEALPACASLRHLNLAGTKVSLEGVEELTEITELESLSVAGTLVADGKLSGAANWKNLQALDLSFTKAGDELLASLAELAKLERLNLARSACTGAGMRHVGKLQQLRELHLDGTSINDVGLEHLLPLKDLETITVKETNITSGAIDFHARIRGKHPAQVKHPLIFRNGWPVLITKGWVQNNAGQEEMVFTASLEEVQILRNPRGRIFHVFNTPAFCVLFEDVNDPLREVWYSYGLMVWLRPPSAEERRVYGLLGEIASNWSYWPQTYSKDWTEVSYQYPMDSADPGFSHKIQIKTDLTRVIVDGNAFDLKYGKKYIVIDNQGNAREVDIP